MTNDELRKILYSMDQVLGEASSHIMRLNSNVTCARSDETRKLLMKRMANISKVTAARIDDILSESLLEFINKEEE